jgi:hypothetical protein|tara:strand:- start:504 stop:998 length:495 start_codon:yes stop_codon:yes gene_type:complete
MNKKATDKILSIYWFIILFIVVAAIVYMVSVFYGEPYDVREIEANVMINNVADCITKNGKLKEDFKEESFKQNFLEKCNLNFNTEKIYDWEKQEQYWINISIYDFSTEKFSFEIPKGNVNLKEFCNKGNSVKCVEREFYTLDKDNIQYTIKILSIIRKTEKNVL